MSQPAKILRQTLVKPFYAANAGAFVLLFTMMFVIVGETHGYGLYAYHHSLAMGMLKAPWLLVSVFLLWLLYAARFMAFVTKTMRQPAFGFMDIFNRLGKTRQFRLLLVVEIWLLLPVLLYAAFVVAVGWVEHYRLTALSITGFLLLLCLAGAAWHVRVLNIPDKAVAHEWGSKRAWALLPSAYVMVLLRFVANRQKAVWAATKLLSCGLLYLTARNNNGDYYDISLPFLFFSLGMLANAVLLYRIREFEESCLSFYRGLRVSLLQRQLQYLLLYGLLLVPEFLTAIWLAPVHLHTHDAIHFSLCAFSLVLLINNISLAQPLGRKEFAVILLMAFAVQYIFMLLAGLVALYLFFFMLAGFTLWKGYYGFDGVRSEQP